MPAKDNSARRLLAANMRRRREELGLSQERLAELAEVHRTYVSQVERGQRNIGIDGVQRIAKALKLSMSQIFA